jgi:nucleotide-binding universal stress UspA family protein
MKESKGATMFDPFLVPLDGSLLAECALPHAIAIARAFEAKAILLRVLDKNQAGEKAQLFDLVNWQINKTGAKQYLEKTSTRIQKSGLRFESVVLEGLVAESITEYSQRQGMKLIILSSHGRSGLSQWGISSVTQKIIFSAPTSVLIIRAHQPAPSELIEQQYKQIMVPLDGSRRAENVLPMVTLLARFFQSRIHIVHVVKTPEMARQMPLAHEDVELSERIVTRNREEAIRYLDQVRLHSPLDGIDIQTHLLTSDNAAAALHELAEKEGIDMVVLSAHGYSGYNQWPYGSMVNNFVLYSKVPLLVVQDLPAKEEPSVAEMTPREHSKL